MPQKAFTFAERSWPRSVTSSHVDFASFGPITFTGMLSLFALVEMFTKNPVDFNSLQTQLGHEFQNLSLLLTAITHRSVKNSPSMERLEFLGEFACLHSRSRA
jgi:hypothetical protein